MNELKIEDQFTYKDSIYKVTHVSSGGKFWAIYIRKADAPYHRDDYITYEGYRWRGDFVTDNVQFEKLATGEIRMVKEALGMLGLLQEAVGE